LINGVQMKYWEESHDEVRKIKPDREMAKALLKMIETRMSVLEIMDRKKFASLVAETYYEIIKEAITALMAIDGYKTLSHEVLIGYLKEFFPQFSEYEIMLADDFRKIRNKIAYKGFFISPDFMDRNEKGAREVVSKLVQTLKKRLNSD